MKAFKFNTLVLLLSLSLGGALSFAEAKKTQSDDASTSSKNSNSADEGISSENAVGKRDIRSDAPTEYVVVKGDTLWGIAKKFLKSPWKWHQLWNMNKKQIKDPHWIYPGEHLILEFDGLGRAHLRKSGQRLKNFKGRLPANRLSPRVRVDLTDDDAIPTISPSEIGPFLSKPLVINLGEMNTAPKIIGSLDDRVILGQGDTVYVQGLPNNGDDEQILQIYRPGRALKLRGFNEDGEPEDKILGYEAIHLGDAKIRKQSEEISSIEIIRAKQEIMKGDKLVTAPKVIPMNYIPRAPDHPIQAEIISLPEGVAETGRNNIVAISAGASNGLSPGHVLAIHRRGRVVSVDNDNNPEEKKAVKLPDERVGLLMVFRVFDNVSYGLVMGSERQIQIGDRLLQP